MISLSRSVEIMADRIAAILDNQVHSIWLYGSVVLDDFCPGWSDIDLLVLANSRITEQQAQQLVGLRQVMADADPANPYYRSFEGIIADRNEYCAGSFSRLVYWGTSGQRITGHYQRDVFSVYELSRYGQCVYGDCDRSIFPQPSEAELRAAVQKHYESIRRYAVQTDDRLWSCGWLLDIARCIYTLRYNDVIAKTRAGFWALSEHLFRNAEPLEKALEIRQNPAAYKDRQCVKQWLKSLGPVVQEYADVLEQELYLADPCRASSLSFRKSKQIAVPDNITVLREDQFDARHCSGTDEPYFKLIHHLREIARPELSAPFETVQCTVEDFARHIRECYGMENIPSDELYARTEQPAYDPGLWLAVIDTETGRIAASGIAEIDPCIREGTLEWIQVSPDYRRRGLGRYIVCELLDRLRAKASFVTVSGKLNSPDNPLALYRSCGFTGCVIWHIVSNQDKAGRFSG